MPFKGFRQINLASLIVSPPHDRDFCIGATQTLTILISNIYEKDQGDIHESLEVTNGHRINQQHYSRHHCYFKS